jgi:uncharacterized membrane protein
MSKFIAAIFENREKAEEGKRVLLRLDHDRAISVYGFCVVSRDLAGNLTVLEPASQGSATGIHELVSELAHVTARLPARAAGLIADLGSWEDLVDFGVTPDFVQKIVSNLDPGKAAILAEIEEAWITPLDTGVEEIGGTIIRTWRSDFEAELAARQGRQQPDRAAKAKHSSTYRNCRRRRFADRLRASICAAPPDHA